LDPADQIQGRGSGEADRYDSTRVAAGVRLKSMNPEAMRRHRGLASAGSCFDEEPRSRRTNGQSLLLGKP
jgi:hypothetical protein